MRSLAHPSLNFITLPTPAVPRRLIRRKKPHYRGSKSGYMGVIEANNNPKRPWKAYLRHQGQYVTIGYFATKEEAARAYNKEVLRVFGPETYLNAIKPR